MQTAITEALQRWSEGDPQSLGQVAEWVEPALRRMARRHLLRERRNHTLQPTALLNEAFLRLLSQNRVRWEDRQRFLAAASLMMRRALADHGRRRQADKRGGWAVMASLPEDELAGPQQAIDSTTLGDLLNRLSSRFPRAARVLELRALAGLSVVETADQLGVSTETVKKDWRLARTWLARKLEAS